MRVLCFFYLVIVLINSSLNNESASASWDKLLEDLFEVAGDLFERSLDSFIFALIKYLHQLFDRLG